METTTAIWTSGTSGTCFPPVWRLKMRVERSGHSLALFFLICACFALETPVGIRPAVGLPADGSVTIVGAESSARLFETDEDCADGRH